jgi:hypothetical protein
MKVLTAKMINFGKDNIAHFLVMGPNEKVCVSALFYNQTSAALQKINSSSFVSYIVILNFPRFNSAIRSLRRLHLILASIGSTVISSTVFVSKS